MTVNITTPAPAATFAEFLIKRNENNDEIGNFHSAMGDHGLEFPSSASAFIESASAGTSGDGDLQHNVEMLAHIMREAGDYLLMALAEHQNKDWQGETA